MSIYNEKWNAKRTGCFCSQPCQIAPWGAYHMGNQIRITCLLLEHGLGTQGVNQVWGVKGTRLSSGHRALFLSLQSWKVHVAHSPLIYILVIFLDSFWPCLWLFSSVRIFNQMAVECWWPSSKFVPVLALSWCFGLTTRRPSSFQGFSGKSPKSQYWQPKTTEMISSRSFQSSISWGKKCFRCCIIAHK